MLVERATSALGLVAWVAIAPYALCAFCECTLRWPPMLRKIAGLAPSRRQARTGIARSPFHRAWFSWRPSWPVAWRPSGLASLPRIAHAGGFLASLGEALQS